MPTPTLRSSPNRRCKKVGVTRVRNSPSGHRFVRPEATVSTPPREHHKSGDKTPRRGSRRGVSRVRERRCAISMAPGACSLPRLAGSSGWAADSGHASRPVRWGTGSQLAARSWLSGGAALQPGRRPRVVGRRRDVCHAGCEDLRRQRIGLVGSGGWLAADLVDPVEVLLDEGRDSDREECEVPASVVYPDRVAADLVAVLFLGILNFDVDSGGPSRGTTSKSRTCSPRSRLAAAFARTGTSATPCTRG